MAPYAFKFADRRAYHHRPTDATPFQYGVTEQPAVRKLDYVYLIGGMHPADLGVAAGDEGGVAAGGGGGDAAAPTLVEGEASNADGHGGWGVDQSNAGATGWEGDNAPLSGGGW
jgi:hypothetical protein